MSSKIRFSIGLTAGFLLFHSIIFAQSSAKDIHNDIKKIDSYLFQNPMQGKIDLLSILAKNPSAPDTTKGLLYLNLAKAFAMVNLVDSGLWAANHSIDFFKHEMEKLYALKIKAIIYRIKGEYLQAELAIKEGLLLNDSIWKNQPLRATFLQEYANLSVDENKFYSATKLYLRALETIDAPGYKDPNLVFNRLKIQVNLAEAYSLSGNHAFAIRQFLQVLPKLDSLKDYDGYVRSGYHLAKSFVETYQYASADSLANKLLTITETLKNDELKSYILLIKGNSLSHQLKFKEAIPYFRQSFELMEKNQSAFILECATLYLTSLKNTNDQEEARKIINSQSVQIALPSAKKSVLLNFKKAAVYFIVNELSPTQLNFYYQEILQLTDSVNNENQKIQSWELLAKYQFEEQEKNAIALTRENKLLRNSEDYKRKQIYLIIVIASLLIATIILLALRIRHRSQIQAQELKVQKKENEIQKQQTDWAIQEKNYRNQLLEQQKIVLTQALADSEELKEKLNQIVEEQGLKQRKEMLEQLEKAKEEKLGLDNLLLRFNSIHPFFIPNLHRSYPKISQSDLQFCMLYRMNMSTKDIALLLQIEPRSIYAKKYRILEKMELGKEDDFDNIIFNRA
jgi:tetratricopeptide (TPR) repeat protein